MKTNEYSFIIVESFIPADTSGRHGPVHIRPLPLSRLPIDQRKLLPGRVK